MGEAKHRAQAAAGEHRRLAARIDDRIKQLDALGMGFVRKGCCVG